MKKLLIVLAFILLPIQSQAAGLYDGVWQFPLNIFATVNQNGSGTLYRLNTESVWPFNIDYGGNEKQQFNGSIFNLGNAPFLDFVYWSQGWMYRPRWMSSETQYKAGNIGIIRAEYPISSLPIKTVDEMQNDIELCVRSGRYRNTCYIF